MIASIRGIIESKGTDRLVVQVGGVGLRLLAPATVISDVGDVGEPVRLLTHLQVREDALTLYGFSTHEQLHLFELLISVTGVGPGHGLSILGLGATEAIQAAIAVGNSGFLSRAPRVGKKLAERVVLELRSKVAAGDGQYSPDVALAPDMDDVVGALVSLGWSSGEAMAAARSVPTDGSLTTEDRIRQALAYFSNQ